MPTRAESAAATRRALLDAAAGLLDAGGPEAVTLRAVGAAAGVSRGAPYGHFPTKEDLLTALAAEQWSATAERLAALRANPRLTARTRLGRALAGWLELARRHPHCYALMFVAPSRNHAALVSAAGHAQDEFLAIVAEATGAGEARGTAAMLLSTAHGIAGLEQAGQLGTEKWGVSADGLLRAVVKRATG